MSFRNKAKLKPFPVRIDEFYDKVVLLSSTLSTACEYLDVFYKKKKNADF